MESSTSQIQANSSFSVATYNVWFGRDGQGSPHPEHRMQAIVELLNLNNKADSPLLVCGLQEVTPALGKILQPLLTKLGYKFLVQPGRSSYGCAYAIHGSVEILDKKWCPYPNTAQARGFLHVSFRLPNSEDEILFATTHLESPVDKEGTTNTTERVAQIRELEAFCNKELDSHERLRAAIIVGDFNWAEEVRDVSLLKEGLCTAWKDAWLEDSSNNADGGFTFDCCANPFLEGERRSRLDRILIRSKPLWHLKTEESLLIGKDPIPNVTVPKTCTVESTNGFETPVKKTRKVEIVPSDHFGLVARFSKSIPGR